ncbi:MAG: hypothetical protein PIR02_09610 [Microbacterium enclense]
MMLLSIGVIAMCVGLAAGVIAVVLPRVGSPTPLGVFLRYSSVSGALSVGAGSMYIVRYSGGGTGTLVIADTTMVLAPAILCVAVWPPSGRRNGSPLALGAAVVVGVVVALSSALLDPETSLRVKAIVLTIVCGTLAVIALRNRVLPHRSIRTLGTAMGAYAVYSALRIVVASTPESPLSQSIFSPTGAGVAAVAAMLMCGVAVGLVGRPVAVPDAQDDRRRTLVAIGDWKLANTAFGTDRVLGLLLELRLAARELDSSAVDGPHGVEVALPAAVSVLRDQMRVTHGWRPEEVELLIDGSTLQKGRRRSGY